jgi:hypothetical protein
MNIEGLRRLQPDARRDTQTQHRLTDGDNFWVQSLIAHLLLYQQGLMSSVGLGPSVKPQG